MNFYKVTASGTHETFPGAMWSDGLLIDSRSGEVVKAAHAWEEVTEAEWTAMCDALGLE